MKAFICVNLSKKRSQEIFPDVVGRLKKNGIEIILSESLHEECRDSGCVFNAMSGKSTDFDLIITIGGDGTILRWGKLAAQLGKPLLGINTGHLGFMATLESDELEKLDLLAKNEYRISRRMMIGAELKTKDVRKSFNALNDIVLSKASSSRLPEFIVTKNEAEVSKIRADGLILSTPTGSTAYSLSAGGPIIDPTMECFELTALCPHTFFNRPMIFPVESIITAGYKSYENSSVFLSVDGGEGIELSENDIITIKKSDLHLDLIDLNATDSFYVSVHNKLMQPLK